MANDLVGLLVGLLISVPIGSAFSGINPLYGVLVAVIDISAVLVYLRGRFGEK